MILRSISLLLAFGLAFLLALPVRAQVEVLTGDGDYQWRQMPRPISLRQAGATPTQKVTAITLPFVDDFSVGTRPDTTRWAYGSDGHEPLLSDAKGLAIPTKGVATFEGTTSAGVKYDGDDATSGLADSLASQPIDLSALSVSDSVYLSFFLQPGGAGDRPEATDSFVVYFDTTGNFDYARVFTVRGNEIPSDKFTQIFVPLDSARYFHGNFRFRFVGWGSLNGENDQWHLDYVRMNSGRTRGDTLINDVSITGVVAFPLGIYSSIPRDQWDSVPRMTAFGMEVSNLKGSASSSTVSVSILDATGNNVFSGTTLVSSPSLSIPAVAHDTAILPAFSDQSLSKVARIRATASITGGGDISSNDVMVRDYGVDSVLAMDDGIADAGYGLTVARSFCQEFEIASADTLTGVMIRFTPAIYVSPIGQVTDLANKSFRLVIWDHLHPDSVLTSVSSGMNIDYGDSLNQFHYYELLTRVRVNGTFWVGIEQADGMPLGVGFDRNNDNSSRVYFADASGGFVNTTNKGTLMIRPVFSNYVFVGRDEPQAAASASLKAWPNPATGDRIVVEANGEWPRQGTELSIIDLSGRTLIQENLSEGNRWEITKPSLPSGIYFLTLRAEGRSLTTKIIF